MLALFTVLESLSAESLRSLDKFMRSPYHVTHGEVLRLYEHLRAHPEAREQTKAQMAAALFSNEPDPLKRLYHVSNYLMEALEQFLALELQAERTHERNIATVEALRRLCLHETGTAMLRYTRRKLEADALRGADFYRADYLLQLESYHLSLQQGRSKNSNVQDLSSAQDVAMIIEKLRTGCILLSHEAVTKQNYDKGLVNMMLAFLDGHPYLEIPAVAVYYHGYFAQLGEQGDFHFQRLKSLLQQYGNCFSKAEIHDLYLMAINFCIRRINLAEEGYYRAIFELYQSGLERGALLEDGTLSRWTYNNITMAGLRLGEFEWTQQFITDYARFLPLNHREAAYHFNLSRYFYDTGDYRQAMQHLLRMEYDDVLQNLQAKVMLAKIYFEQEEMNALENQLDSIQIYIRRKKVLGYHKDNYTAIVFFMRKLLAVNMNNSKEVLLLRNRIDEASVLTEREWLLKQL